MSRRRLPRFIGGCIIETFRGTSALVQLFWVYYVFPLFGLNLPPFLSATIVLGLNSGSYFSEIIRSAFVAITSGQREAALALHLPRTYVFRRILLPQALPLIMPGFGNMLISLLKFTSLASLVTVQDLSFKASMLRTAFGQSGAIYTATLIIYFILALVLGRGVRALEYKAAIAAGRETERTHSGSDSFRVPRWALSR